MMKLLKKSRGFTILEVLIVLVILSVISSSIFALMNVANVNFSVGLGMLDLHQQARQAMEWIVKEARQASLVTITNGSAISINIPSATGIQYYLGSNCLLRQYPAGTIRTIAHNISGLTFSQANKMLTVTVTANNTVQLKPLTFSLTQVVRLRNE